MGQKQGSMAGSLGAGMGTAVRYLKNKKEGKRLLNGVLAGGHAFMQSVGKVGRILFLEVTGFLFLVIAVVIGSKTFHEYLRVKQGTGDRNHVVVGILFGAMFLYFGLSSFWRARRK